MGFMPIYTLICILSFHIHQINADGTHQINLETYIVRVDVPGQQFFENLESWHNSFLPKTTSSSNEEPRMIYSYRNVFTGFAARLSADEVKAMEKMEGFLSATPQKVFSLQTTHSPDFLGLHQSMGFWKDSNYGKGVIIGVLDTGITPDHPSFSDEGMPPPPAKWKGRCETACNNKLIGARSFRIGNGTPLDEDGHGSHTAGIAAGNFVKDANVFGNANGTAAGVAPFAHLAIYKVCITGQCSESDVLAAMDTAIDDGVDVLSLSLDFGFFRDFYSDNLAVGAYATMEKGIFVSCSAGNGGPAYGTLTNVAPWILTVGASTIDRKIRTTVVLGNKEEFNGESFFQPKDFSTVQLPLVFPGMNTSDPDAQFCFSSSLNNIDVKGKIVLCVGTTISTIDQGQAVKNASGAGMILMNQAIYANTTFAVPHVLPASHVTFADGQKMIDYINSTSMSTAAIVFKGTIIGDDHAPVVAAFSSRGPSVPSPGILKPDIIGPGENIIAAWPLSVENNTNTKATFNVLSGTSMSCPHLSGVAALLKSAHPEWSPAAIKSAMMTTADVVNLANEPIEDERFLPADIFAIGAGHVNPSRSNDPGLIYDIKPEDYVPYLCGLNYTDEQMSIILRRKFSCSGESTIPEAQLNYPSFSIILGSATQTYSRTVTNVGEAVSSYSVEIVAPLGVDVKVEPDTLNFWEINQKMTYEVTFSRSATNVNGNFSQGFLRWTSTKYKVRSPIAVIFSENTGSTSSLIVT